MWFAGQRIRLNGYAEKLPHFSRLLLRTSGYGGSILILRGGGGGRGNGRSWLHV